LLTESVFHFIGFGANGPVTGNHDLVSTRQSNERSISHRINGGRVETDRYRGRNQTVGRRV